MRTFQDLSKLERHELGLAIKLANAFWICVGQKLCCREDPLGSAASNKVAQLRAEMGLV